MIDHGRFGPFGGTYVPEILVPALEQLEQAFLASKEDDAFKNDLETLLARYVGRPTPIYKCRNFASETGATIYLKREDLAHGGAHKTNQVLAQGLLAKRMGKTRIIAETGAGQHGVACALIGALLQMETVVYMGAKDVARQQPNVFRMELMGAKVIPVSAGSSSLKDAINEALRDWAQSFHSSHYLLGTVAGPHPFPTLVRDFQKIIGEEAKRQILQTEGRLPDTVMACVGGGSNAIGMFYAFVPDTEVELIGVEPGGHGVQTELHGATLGAGKPGILHGCRTYILQDDAGQIHESHSVSAGLDYPGVGPEHAYLKDSGRAQYVNIMDQDALAAFSQLCKLEGIIPALESAHALAHALKIAKPGQLILVNLSGRGDKDLATVRNHLEVQS